MERLLLLRPQVRHALDPLQFASQAMMGVEDVSTSSSGPTLIWTRKVAL